MQKAILVAVMAALLLPVLNRVGVDLSKPFQTIANTLQHPGASLIALDDH